MLQWSVYIDSIQVHTVHTFIYIFIHQKNDSNQTNRKEQKKTKKLDSEHNIENTVTTVTYTPT